MENYKPIPHFAINQGKLYWLFFFLLAIFFALQLFMGGRLITGIWLLAGFLIVIGFFFIVHKLERRTVYFSTVKFEKRLFLYSLAARLLAVLVLVIIAELTWDRPIYVGAVDAVRYFRVAGEVGDLFWDQGLLSIPGHLNNEYGVPDAYGVPFVLGLIFALTTKSAIIAKIFIAFMGSLSVVLIYRTAALFFDQPTAKLAGLLAAFMPLSLFFDAVILKESFVVFLTSLSIYLSSKIVATGKISLRAVLILIFAVVAIFFFRVAAGAVIVASLVTFFPINRVKGNPIYAWMIGAAVILSFIFIVHATGHSDFFMDRIERGTEHGEARVSQVERRTTWQDLQLGPMYIILSHFGPFPSMVETSAWQGPFSHNSTYYWISGLIVWNILSLFALLGMWRMIRKMPKKTLMIWGYTAGYSIVLGITAMFTQVRLGWNVIPMMMIPAAVGLRHYRQANYFYLALGIAGLLVIAWNVFRAMGRGLM